MTSPAAEDPLIVFRVQILDALKRLEPEHEWVTTEMLVKFFEMAHKCTYTLSKLGNNLRVLHKHRAVEWTTMGKSTRWWRATGTPYNPDPFVKLLIVFPTSVHDLIAEFSKKGGTSKNAFVVNMVRRGAKRLVTQRNQAAKRLEAERLKEKFGF